MQTYSTLDQALADIARRSFHQSAKVTPAEINGETHYTVENWETGHDDYVNYEDNYGIEVRGYALDYSRVHESYESYGRAEHIRRNLPTAAETLECGTPVSFQYVIVDSYCDGDCDIDSDGYCAEDHIVGWALLAYLETGD